MVANHDVVVIGAGHNGLVSANYLARAGLDVCVVEAAPTVGGMSGTQALIPEAPQHMINYCAVDVIFLHATKIVDELELRKFGYQEISVDPAVVYLHADGSSIAFWRDPARTAREIERFSRSDAAKYLELMRLLNGMLDMGVPFLLTNPVRPDTKALLGAARATGRNRRLLSKLLPFATASAAQVVDENFQHPVVRDAMATQCAISSPITTDGSSLNMMVLAFAQRFGATRPVGGTQTLPDSLAAAFRAKGGSICTGTPVEEIVVSGGRTTGVRLTSGKEITARRAVVASCDPRTALGRLLPEGALEPAMVAKVNNIPTCAEGYGSFKVDLALSGKVTLRRHQEWRNDDLDLREPSYNMGGFDEAVRCYPQAAAGELPEFPLIWAAIPTAVDATQAPAGQDTLYLWAQPVPHKPRNQDWSDMASTAGQGVVSLASKYFDGLGELEIGRWVETPEDFAQRLNVTDGCIYHVDFSTMRLGPLRPALGLSGYRTPVRGLFLGGSGSHPSPGLTGLPGRLAAREVLRRKNR